MITCFTQFNATRVETSYNCECIAAYKDKILVGTKQGYIIVYSISYNPNSILTSPSEYHEQKVQSEFCFIIKEFNKKPVLQISVIEEFGIFLVLADGKIFVFRLNDYRPIHIIDNLKGIMRFCHDLYEDKDATTTKNRTRNEMLNIAQKDDTVLSKSLINDTKPKGKAKLRICVAYAKTKLSVFQWNATNCKMEPKYENRIPDTPRCIKLFFDNIFIGTKTEYFLLNVRNSEVHGNFNVGRTQEPYAFRMSDFIGVKIDDTVEFIDRWGNILEHGTLKWSSNPSQIIYHPPFTIANLNKSIEVRMASPSLFIQTLLIDGISRITRYQDRIYILLENNQVCCLVGTPRLQLVQYYSKNEDFESALMLAKTASLVGEKEIDCTRINTNYAKTLFRNKRFQNAFNIFLEMNIDPFDVLNLYPSLCPDKIVRDSKLRQLNENFTKEDNQQATNELIDFLVKWRHKLRKKTAPVSNQSSLTKADIDNAVVVLCYGMNDGVERSKLKNQLLQIVDTSLLKCYLDVKPQLVAPLLRQDNNCHEEETRKLLIKYEKHQELILLYQNKEKHGEALALLHDQAVKVHSQLRGLSPIVNYMKNLSPKYLDLVYQFGDVVLEKRPKDWLSIFQHWDHHLKPEDSKSANNPEYKYPRYKDRIVKHLQSRASHMLLPFLERTIYRLNEDDDYDNDDDDDEDNEDKDDMFLDDDRSISLSIGGGYKNLVGSNVHQLKSANVIHPKISLVDLDLSSELPLEENNYSFNIGNMHTIYAQELIKQILKTCSTEFLCIRIEDEKNNPITQLYELRRRLKLFLECPKTQYRPAAVLAEFPYDCLYEERAAVLARDGKHEQALTLWIHLFKNWKLAEQHCARVYKSHPSIYLTLLKICVEPSEPSAIGIVLPSANNIESNFIIDRCNSVNDNHSSVQSDLSPMKDMITNEYDMCSEVISPPSISKLKFRPHLEKAVEILNRFSNKLPVVETLQLVSEVLTVKDLLKFVQNALRHQSSRIEQTAMLRNIQFYHKLSSNLRSCDSARCYFSITEETICGICQKSIMGDSAVARYPDGFLVHYGCCKHLPKYEKT